MAKAKATRTDIPLVMLFRQAIEADPTPKIESKGAKKTRRTTNLIVANKV